MLENMTTGEKALIGATAVGIAALIFHKPTRNAVGLADRKWQWGDKFDEPKYKIIKGIEYRTNNSTGSKVMAQELAKKQRKLGWKTVVKQDGKGLAWRVWSTNPNWK